jgi:hypothetical protein
VLSPAIWLPSLSQIYHDHLGGDSFVQLWTGLNLAFFAWDRYQGLLGSPRRKCEQIIEAITANVLDQPEQRIRIVAFLARFSKYPTMVLHLICQVCRYCAGVLFLIGVWSLYIGNCDSWDLILILPTAFYLIVSILALAITAFLGWCLGLVPRTVKIVEEIKKAAQATKN